MEIRNEVGQLIVQVGCWNDTFTVNSSKECRDWVCDLRFECQVSHLRVLKKVFNLNAYSACLVIELTYTWSCCRDRHHTKWDWGGIFRAKGKAQANVRVFNKHSGQYLTVNIWNKPSSNVKIRGFFSQKKKK